MGLWIRPKNDLYPHRTRTLNKTYLYVQKSGRKDLRGVRPVGWEGCGSRKNTGAGGTSVVTNRRYVRHGRLVGGVAVLFN